MFRTCQKVSILHQDLHGLLMLDPTPLPLSPHECLRGMCSNTKAGKKMQLLQYLLFIRYMYTTNSCMLQNAAGEYFVYIEHSDQKCQLVHECHDENCV